MDEDKKENEKNVVDQITALQESRIKQASEEIQAILDKYQVQLSAFAVVPAQQVKIVPR